MEQTVWVAFGVLAVIVGFTIVINLINQNVEDKKIMAVDASLIKLKDQCNFVCDSALDTKLPTNVDLPSNMVLYTNSKRICAKYAGEVKCELCICDLNNFTLDLNTSAAREFSMHTYACTFLRLENGTQMECKG